MRYSIVLLLVAFVAAPLRGQDEAAEDASQAKFRLALLGFGARAGVDFSGDDQLVFGSTLDLGDLYTDRLRMRATGELGLGGGADTYVIGAEVTYRFVADVMATVPYIGGGVALYSQEDCASESDCPAFWPQFVLGFEMDLRAPVRWLVEYHAEDGFSRHRLLVGLATRRER
jgi:hypothetical protein